MQKYPIVKTYLGVLKFLPQNQSYLTQRIVTEFFAVLLFPLQCTMLVLFPLLPLTAVGFAEFERGRARECGEKVSSQRPSDQAWVTWIARRVRTPNIWKHDIPLTIISTILGLVSSVFITIISLSLIFLIMAPFLFYWRVGITVGSIDIFGLTETIVFEFINLTVVAILCMFLIAVSRMRDVFVLALSQDEAAELTEELNSIRNNRTEIVKAFEQERRRIEQDLHDGVQQDLLALSMQLGILEYHMEGKASVEYDLALRARNQVDRTLKSLREIVYGIHPKELSDLGLTAAITGLCDRSAVAVELNVKGEVDHIDIAAASALFFTAAEALSNIERHAKTDHAYMSIDQINSSVHLVVVDTGIGTAQLNPDRSTGLNGLRERMRGVNGELHIISQPEQGTRIEAIVPVIESQADTAITIGKRKKFPGNR